MIKTLKSELKLRPTYDEMIGMTEAQSDENRPSIETVIDRKATLFRNNQFGSQFDNIDFLGLKKQEEDRAKESVRQAQLRQTAISTGSSMGVLSSSGFTTPAEVYEATDDDDDMTSEEATRIRAEMERYLQRQQQTQQSSSSTARTDLDEAHRQSLPAGVEMYRMNTGGTDEMTPLETPTEIVEEEEEEEEEFEDDEEVEVDNNNDLKYWERKTLKQLEEQLEFRGIQLDKKQLQEMERLKPKGKGKETTKKQYLLNVIEGLIKSGKWNSENTMKGGKGKGSGGSRMPREASAEASSSDVVPSQQSASSTAKDILISGAKAGVETLAKAGATALAKSFLPA